LEAQTELWKYKDKTDKKQRTNFCLLFMELSPVSAPPGPSCREIQRTLPLLTCESAPSPASVSGYRSPPALTALPTLQSDLVFRRRGLWGTPPQDPDRRHL